MHSAFTELNLCLCISGPQPRPDRPKAIAEFATKRQLHLRNWEIEREETDRTNARAATKDAHQHGRNRHLHWTAEQNVFVLRRSNFSMDLPNEK